MLGRWHAWLVAVLLILLSASCGHEATTGQPSESREGVLPALPADTPFDLTKPITKTALVDLDLVQNGDQALFVGGTHLDGSDLVLSPAADKPMAWAVFQYPDVAPYYRVDGVHLELKGLDSNADNHCFVGFADYSSHTWRLQPIPGNNSHIQLDYQPVTIAVPAGDFFPASAGGTAYIAIITTKQDLTVGKCTLKVDAAGPAPLGLTATQGTDTDGVRLQWIAPELTFDPDGDGPATFEYSGVDVERYDNDTGEWTLIATVSPGITTYFDPYPASAPDPATKFEYRLSTLIDNFPGQTSQPVQGWLGIVPEAYFTVSGTAPDLVLDPSGSFDPDASPELVLYHWNVWRPADPNYIYQQDRFDGSPFDLTLTDLTTINRIELIVQDQEGLYSRRTDMDLIHDASSFYLWSPNLGCVQDDPNNPDPKDTIQGQGPGSYTAKLQFMVNCGSPNYKFEVDTDFEGVFANGPAGAGNVFVPTVVVKDFATNPNTDGLKDYTINIPANQPDGQYYFAVRVTDGNGEESIYMWPDKVTLAP